MKLAKIRFGIDADMYFIIELLLMFFIFSFFGWVIETIYCSALQKRFVHRGFLNGPVCPIYGTGALAVGIPLSYIKINPLFDIFLIFVLGVVICSVVEYLIGFALEKIFKMKLWDYSDYPLNLHGRIWLGYSLGWGVMSLFLVYLINPGIRKLLTYIPFNFKVILIVFVSALFIADILFTIFNIQAISKKLAELKSLFSRLQQKFKLAGEQGSDFNDDFGNRSDEELDNYRKLAQKLSKRRILRAFPHFTLKKFSEQLRLIKNKIKIERKKK